MSGNVQNKTGGLTINTAIGAGNKYRVLRKTMGAGATLVLTDRMPPLIVLDADAGSNVITLPSVTTSEGLFFIIANAEGAAGNLTVNNSLAALVVSVTPGLASTVVCDGVRWFLA